MEYVYHSKKNGKDYVYTTEIVFALPQDAYAWRRGVREYADNYTASIGKPGTGKDNAYRVPTGRLVDGKPELRDATTDEFVAEIGRLNDEALARFNAGDVPSERGPTDPAQADMRKVVAALLASGWSADQVVEALAKKKKAA